MLRSNFHPGTQPEVLDASPEELATLWRPTDGTKVELGSSSRDGKVLAVVRAPQGAATEIWLLERGGAPWLFLASRFHARYPDISPDGRWLLYTSWETGHPEVFARPLSGEGGRQQVSNSGGDEPLWSREGTSVYCWRHVDGGPGSARVVHRVPVRSASGSLSFGISEPLFERPFADAAPGHGWDVAPDGRFLLGKEPGEAASRSWWEKVLSNRVVVDTGGVARLLADGKPER